jgi:hypothetical protein
MQPARSHPLLRVHHFSPHLSDSILLCFAKIQVIPNVRFRDLRVVGHHKLIVHDEPVELSIASGQRTR